MSRMPFREPIGAELLFAMRRCAVDRVPGLRVLQRAGREILRRLRRGAGEPAGHRTRDATGARTDRLRDEADRIGLRNTLPALDEALAAA